MVYIFRRLKCIHVYECLSHGREWWYSLHMTTDIRYTLRELPPISENRKVQCGSLFPLSLCIYICTVPMYIYI